ncbi:MAG: AMP-binding protein [Mangrovicoccus sp.]|nr:AMP-binding protein [Mangrovicoccus sp.]
MSAVLPELNPKGYNSVLDIFDDCTKAYGQTTAYSALGREMSYSELEQKTAAFAAFLRQSGLKPGDRIAVQLPNLLQSPIAVFGAIRAGLVVVNTNPLYTGTELLHQLTDSGAKALVVLANSAHIAADVVPKTGVGLVIVTEVGDMHPPLKRMLINTVLKHVKKMVPAYQFANAVSFRDALSQGAKAPKVQHSAEAKDVLLLQYTGGTTGPSKAAILTHGNLLANMCQVGAHLDERKIDPGEVWVGPLPLYHIFGFTAHNLVFFSRGCHSLLIPNPRDLESFAKALKGKKFHGFLQINTLIVALTSTDSFKALDFSSLKITVSGGTALTHAAAEKWQALTGCVVTEAYGMSETSPGTTANKLGREKIGSIGVALAHTELRLVDDAGQDVPDGDPGELWIRGPQVMQGYWNAPEATAKTLTDDGWLKSGDIAIKDPDESYRIVDRKKDLVIVSGFNVAPNEVEDVVSQMPQVNECAVVGVPDEKTGEAVCLFVVPEADRPSPEQITDFCRQHLTSYKVPKRIEYVKELPKNAVGKVLRRELRKEYTGAA